MGPDVEALPPRSHLLLQLRIEAISGVEFKELRLLVAVFVHGGIRWLFFDFSELSDVAEKLFITLFVNVARPSVLIDALGRVRIGVLLCLNHQV